MRIVIVSHKRADRVITTNIIRDPIICVPEAQKEEYAEHNPGIEIVTHPDEVIGSSPKRQWIYEKFGDVFMIDDDVMYMNRVYRKRKEKVILTKDETTDVITDTFHLCKENGIFLFGFNRVAHPKAFKAHQPIKMNGYLCGGAYGMIKGSKNFFPNYPYFVADDYFLSAINAYYHRYCWIDSRFSFAYNETEAGQGGCADYRTEERRKESYIYLKKHFGDAIVPRKDTSIKRVKSRWEKTLKIPY